MMTHTEISFTSKNYEDGFGFACMKAAYSFGITGRMDYCSESDVKISAEGEQDKIVEFIQWIEANVKDHDKILYNSPMKCTRKFKEFDIYCHSLTSHNY